MGVLMLEILLTRIFSFTVWYHLAYLTISTALLGFAAAGTLLAMVPRLAEEGGSRVAALGSSCAGVTLIVGLAVIAPHPISPDRLLSEPARFFVELLGYYAVVAVPFFLGGVAVAVPLAAYPLQANRLYAADLLGAAGGCALAVAGLTWLDGPGALAVCAAILLAAGACYADEPRLRAGLVAGTIAAIVGVPQAHRVLHFVPTDTKALGQALANPRTEVLYTRWSPVNRVDMYRMKPARAGFWSYTGRSRLDTAQAPRRISIQYDGHNGSDIFEVGGKSTLGMLDGHILSTPYMLGKREHVLVIGVGGGVDVLNALHHGVPRVTGVELQPITVEILQDRMADWTGGWFNRPEVELVAGEGRHYVRSRKERYDLIQITAVDTFSAQSTGAYVLAESFLYTVEAFGDYLGHLNEDGIVSVILGDPLYRDTSLPPPLSTRLMLVAREALEIRGASPPSAHMLLIARVRRSANASDDDPTQGAATQNLLVKNTPFNEAEVAEARRWATRHGFEVRYAPGGPALPPIRDLVEDSGRSLGARLEAARFALEPVTDDNPFFYNVLRWRSLLTGERVVWYFPGSATGQAVLLMMLGQAVLLGGVLVALPLLGRRAARPPARRTAGYLAYFLALGLGFLLIEISFVQKYVLILGYPTYSLSVTILSLLLFAAVGAFLSQRFWRGDIRRFLAGLLLATVALIALEVIALSWIRDAALALSLPSRIAITILLQLPIGVALGMYFPTGLEILRRNAPQLIPWAWAVNGVASVASTVLAVILGMGIGFSGVAWVAVAIYAAGTLALITGALPPLSEERQ
jgi:hypothetical protein